MEPTVMDGNVIRFDPNGFSHADPKRGDVVIHTGEGYPAFVRRVIGLPGETVTIADGAVFVDGQALGEPYLAAGTRTDSAQREFVLPSDSFFLMGDNREQSRDSRSTGPVPRSAIVGRVSFAPPTTAQGFLEAVPLPNEISTDPEVIGTNALLSVLLVVFAYLGASIFNSTLREHHDLILRRIERLARWTELGIHRDGDTTATRPQRIAMTFRSWEGVLSVLTLALLYSFLDPYFNPGLRGVALFASLTLAVAAVTSSYEGVQVLVSTRGFGVPSRIRLYPIAIAVAVLFVYVSRTLDFHPGLTYGFVGAYASMFAGKKLDQGQHAVVILVGALALLTLAVLAFYVRLPLSRAWGGGGFWPGLVDAVLVAVFVMGLEGLLFSMVPLTFMDGAMLASWRRSAWLGVFLTASFLFYHIIINEDGHLPEAARNVNTVATWLMMAMFLGLSFVTWGYFRWRADTRH